MSAMVSKQKNRCKLSAQVLAYLTWKNFGGQPIEVAVLYPFIEGHFPRYANCRTTYDPIDFTRKSIRTSLTNYFEGTISETRENPQRWTVKSAYMQNLEEEAQKCLPGGVLHAQMVAIMARPDLLVRLVDGTWGAKGPDGAELHKTKKAQEAEKKSRKRCSPTEAVRKPRKKKRTVEGGAFVAAPSYYAQHSMHYQYGYPTQWNPHTLQMAQQRYGAPYPTQGYWHQPTMLPYPQPVVLPYPATSEDQQGYIEQYSQEVLRGPLDAVREGAPEHSLHGEDSGAEGSNFNKNVTCHNFKGQEEPFGEAYKQEPMLNTMPKDFADVRGAREVEMGNAAFHTNFDETTFDQSPQYVPVESQPVGSPESAFEGDIKEVSLTDDELLKKMMEDTESDAEDECSDDSGDDDDGWLDVR